MELGKVVLTFLISLRSDRLCRIRANQNWISKVVAMRNILSINPNIRELDKMLRQKYPALCAKSVCKKLLACDLSEQPNLQYLAERPLLIAMLYRDTGFINELIRRDQMNGLESEIFNRIYTSILTDNAEAMREQALLEVTIPLVKQEKRNAVIAVEGQAGTERHTALYCAVACRNTVLIDLLLQNDANVNAIEPESKSGRTPLLLALSQGDCNVAMKLVLAGALLNAVDAQGNSALHIAVSRKNERLCTYLSEHRHDLLFHKNVDGKTPIDLAVTHNYISFLRQYYSSDDFGHKDKQAKVEAYLQLVELAMHELAHLVFEKIIKQHDNLIYQDPLTGNQAVLVPQGFSVSIFDLKSCFIAVTNTAEIASESQLLTLFCAEMMIVIKAVSQKLMKVALQKNYRTVIKNLIKQTRCTINAPSPVKDQLITPLHYAVMQRDCELVTMMIESRVDDLDEHSFACSLRAAIIQGDLVLFKLLLAKDRSVDNRIPMSNTVVDEILCHSKIDFLHALINSRLFACVSNQHELFAHAAFWAIKFGQAEAVEVLADAGVGLNFVVECQFRNSEWMFLSTLGLASVQGDVELLDKLHKLGVVDGVIQRDAKVRVKTALFAAIEFNQLECAERLLQYDYTAAKCIESDESRSARYNAALKLAVREGYSDAVVLLLKYGARTAHGDRDGENAIDLAIQFEKLDIFNLLVELVLGGREGCCNEDDAHALINSIRRSIRGGNFATVYLGVLVQSDNLEHILLNRGIYHELINMMLIYAAQRNNHSLAGTLLANGADANVQFDLNVQFVARRITSALMSAAKNNHNEMVVLLISNCNFNVERHVNEGVFSALEAAGERGYLEIAENLALLYKKESRTQAHRGLSSRECYIRCLMQAGGGVHAFAYAIEHDDVGTMGRLVAKGYVIDQKIKPVSGLASDDSLCHALYYKKKRAALWLMKQFGDQLKEHVFIDAKIGESAIGLALKNGWRGIAKKLIRSDDNDDQMQRYIFVALCAAVDRGDFLSVGLLINEGFNDFSRVDDSERTLLMRAVSHASNAQRMDGDGSVDIVKKMLESGADIGAPPSGGSGLLAAALPNPALLDVLLVWMHEHSIANMQQALNEVLVVAVKHRHLGSVKMLVDHGAVISTKKKCQFILQVFFDRVRRMIDGADSSSCHRQITNELDMINLLADRGVLLSCEPEWLEQIAMRVKAERKAAQDENIKQYWRLVMRALIKLGVPIVNDGAVKSDILKLCENDSDFKMLRVICVSLLGGLVINEVFEAFKEYVQPSEPGYFNANLKLDDLVQHVFIWHRHAIVDAIEELPQSQQQTMAQDIFSKAPSNRALFLAKIFASHKTIKQRFFGLFSRHKTSACDRLRSIAGLNIKPVSVNGGAASDEVKQETALSLSEVVVRSCDQAIPLLADESKTQSRPALFSRRSVQEPSLSQPLLASYDDVTDETKSHTDSNAVGV